MEIAQAFLTAGLTAGVGLTGWIGLRCFADPILEQRRVRTKIANALVFYANAYAVGCTSGDAFDEIREASADIRSLAAELRATRHNIPCYRLLERFRLVLPRSAVISVAADLTGWSNSLYDDGSVQPGERFERRMRIGELLGFDHDVDVDAGTRDARVLSSTRTEAFRKSA